MPKSEIDEIFASSSKGRGKFAQKAVSVALDPTTEKKKKRKHEASLPAAETILDPSVQVPSGKKRKTGRVSSAPRTKASKDNTTEDEDRFNDSRGTGPRRKTEEGWLIFKEDELGINDEGGDTPMCPFDCQCCF
ncbi:hypothetical protein E1B28_001214 [Marasmius oreades]|uniref:DUF1764-domain-containing protein n=1 Tax=Marasmius oreades TaxID=181124 RepID=A0A9P8AFA7_9AGAR|nr:uncharacterized protein E1B28_001214 [Marasmius oreades]KAG7099358.1 hypothetical protein E1B28_001214 [Marasmius oreades]